MKVTLLILSCLAYFASAQLTLITFNAAASTCTQAGGCNLVDILSAASISAIITSLTGGSYSLDFSQLSGGSTVNIAASGSLSNTLTLGALSTGTTSLNIASGMVINTGSFLVNGGTSTVAGTIAITQSAASNASVVVSANANLVVQAGGQVQANAAQIVAQGQVTVAGQISSTTSYTQSSAALILNSTYNAASNNVAVVSTNITIGLGATLQGNGALGGSSASASAGVTVYVSGSLSVGNSPGVVTINGDWRPGTASTFNFEAASASSYDQLIVSGKAYVNGICKCTLLNNYGPAPDTRFTFINAAGGTDGSFTGTIGTGNNAFKWSTSVTSNTVIANYNSAVSVAISGLVLIACVLASLL